MATLYITEFSALGTTHVGTAAQVAAQPPTAEQTLTVSATASNSAAFKNSTTFVRLHADTACSMIFATAGTATTAKMRLAQNQTEYFQVPRASSYYASVVSNS